MSDYALPAARFKLSVLDPESTAAEVEHTVTYLEKYLSGDELATLIAHALDEKQQAKKQLEVARARVSVLFRARDRQQVKLKSKGAI